MRYLYSCLVVAIWVNVISAEEEKTEHNVIDYVQELTGKIDTMTQVIEALEKRIEILEAASHSRGVEEKGKSLEKISEVIPVASVSPKRTSSSANADQLWNNGNAALQNKNFAEAEQQFADLLRRTPTMQMLPRLAIGWVK
jgi:outer membrane protein assembly factor BamD (BamD/ComL family)